MPKKETKAKTDEAKARLDLDLAEGKKVFISDLLSGKSAGKDVTLYGWVWRKRVQAESNFIMIRDSTGVIQVVAPNATVKSPIYIEQSLEVKGKLVKDERAPGGYEIKADQVGLVGESKEYPISKDFSEEFLLDVRHLWNRSTLIRNMCLVRETVMDSAREWLKGDGWHEVSPPILTGNAAEGGATLFELDYFGKKAFLSQSAQLYLETLIYPLEKVWSITPSFRAEKSRTKRHMAEFWHLEAECAWLNFEGILRVEEKLIEHIVHAVAKARPKELAALGRDPEDLLKIKAPFKRMHYDDVVKTLNDNNIPMKYGEDIATEQERFLTKDQAAPIIVMEYPKAVKPFYTKVDAQRPDLVYSADMLAPEGYGEISSGGQREEDLAAIVERIKSEGFNPKDYEWYLDMRRYGSIPHSGFGFGIDRLTRWIAKRDTILDTIPYPRTMSRIYP